MSLAGLIVALSAAACAQVTPASPSGAWTPAIPQRGGASPSGLAASAKASPTVVPTPVVPNLTPNVNLLQNPSLETETAGAPECWTQSGHGTNAFVWGRALDAHTGAYAQSVSISSYTDGDRKFVSAQDGGKCAPAVAAGHAYKVTAWYKSAIQPYVFVYYRNNSGTWVYWQQSGKLAAAESWQEATFATPVVPAGVAFMSVGIGISGVGSVAMDDFGLFLAS